LGREADHSFPSGVEVKMLGAIPLVPTRFHGTWMILPFYLISNMFQKNIRSYLNFLEGHLAPLKEAVS
jgi:hypothetical protein